MSREHRNQSHFRIGIVKMQDPANGRVRVVFPDRDQIPSWWLQVVVPKTQRDKAYWMPDLGEQVVCLMDECDEAGAVLGAVYSSADQTPVSSNDKWHYSFEDNTSFEYDRAAHVLDIKLSDGAEIKYDAAAHLLTLKSIGDITLVTNEHNTTLNQIIDTYNAHKHPFTDSAGDSGPTDPPSTAIP